MMFQGYFWFGFEAVSNLGHSVAHSGCIMGIVVTNACRVWPTLEGLRRGIVDCATLIWNTSLTLVKSVIKIKIKYYHKMYLSIHLSVCLSDLITQMCNYPTDKL